MTSLPYLNTGIHFTDYSLTMSSKKVTGLGDSLTAKQEVKRSGPRIEERYYLSNKHLRGHVIPAVANLAEEKFSLERDLGYADASSHGTLKIDSSNFLLIMSRDSSLSDDAAVS
jgi:hypothetical protein